MAGPSAALHASFKRLGWWWTQPWQVCDDRWRTWDVRVDPPAAIAGAVRATVRTLRLKEIGQQHPGLIPESDDTGHGNPLDGTITIDFAGTLSSLASGKKASLKDTPEWEKSHAASLLSAASGGQWPQAREAQVKKWCISDNKCQLCHAAVGTAAHRLKCPRNTPPQGGRSCPSVQG